MKSMTGRIIAVIVVMYLVLGLVVVSDHDLYLKIYRGIDTFGKVYKEVSTNYVDEVDPDRFMRAGIDGMLKTLDPYTVYIGEREGDEIDLVTNGKYGGVGITIGLRDGKVTVVNLLDGFSAAKHGIQVGDHILEVDGNPLTGDSFDSVRSLVRGAPGTEVRMKIEREGDPAPLEFVLIREEISVRNVTFSGYVDKGIGYIKLERFSRTAGDDVRLAIRDLRTKGELRGIVLDLRDNPGGLLDMAVDVASKFLPESSLVVTTRGRRGDSHRSYLTMEKPMVADIPLAVLVDRGSASASEIVAGAIQDLDRGVIVGTRTFGKGLVQTITRLSENTSLKITTGRYYTPSGRSIQEIDYFNRTNDGGVTVIADSLKRVFTTVHNRKVYEGGGIKPDSTVPVAETSRLVVELLRKAMFFKFANRFAAEKRELRGNEISDALLAEFETFVREKGFEYQEEGEEKLAELREAARQGNYGKEFFDHLKRLSSVIEKEKSRVFQRHREEIRKAVRDELIGRIKGEKGRIEAGLKEDRTLQTALALLARRDYNSILSGKD
jgi:carboxyl-terminal processing protease